MLNLDTHILVFALGEGLTRQERQLLAGDQWGISAIVLWELTKLHQLGRITLDTGSPEFARTLAVIQVWPLDLAVCRATRSLDFRGDPADEIIAATSIVHRSPLVTRDRRILASRVVTLA